MRAKFGTLERALQILLGVIVAVAALVPLVLSFGLPLTIGNGSEWRWAAPAGLLSALLTVWCVRTSWRLIAARPRPDGGLLSPWLIAGAGVVASVGVVFGLMTFGMRWLGGALYLATIAAGCFEMARRRFRRQRRVLRESSAG